MDPATLMMLIGSAQSVIGGISAATNRRPEYDVPPAMREALSLARARASMNAPNYQTDRESIDLMAANAASNAMTVGNSAAIPTIQAQQQAGQRNLANQNAAYHNEQDSRLQSALDAMAQGQDLEYQMNEFAPYADRNSRSLDAVGAGMQNIMTGLDLKGGANLPEMSKGADAPQVSDDLIGSIMEGMRGVPSGTSSPASPGTKTSLTPEQIAKIIELLKNN